MDENEVVRELFKMMGMMKMQSVHFHGHVDSSELKRSEYMLLMSIGGKGMCGPGGMVKVSDLSTHHHISRPAISQMLGSLEKKGFISRRTDDKDRRIVWVDLTEQGKQAFERANKAVFAYIRKIISLLGEEDTKMLTHLLSRLYEIIKNLENEERKAK